MPVNPFCNNYVCKNICKNQPIKVSAYFLCAVKEKIVKVTFVFTEMTEIHFAKFTKTKAPETEIFQGMFETILHQVILNVLLR